MVLLLQFAFVHFYTKYGYGEVYFPQPPSSSPDETESEDEVGSAMCVVCSLVFSYMSYVGVIEVLVEEKSVK